MGGHALARCLPALLLLAPSTAALSAKDRCSEVLCTSDSWAAACCSAGKALPWNIQPLANFRFGSVFRNAIPPKRDYSPPSFEEIFERRESSTRRSHQLPQIDQLARFPETDRNSESTTSSYFRSQLDEIQERNQDLLFPKISTTQRPEGAEGTTEDPAVRRREEQYLRAQQKLLQLQREQASRIKAQQSQSKLMQMVLAKQREQQQRKRQKEEEEKRKQEDQKLGEARGRSEFEKNTLREKIDFLMDQKKYQTHFDPNTFEKKFKEVQRRQELETKRQQEEEMRKRVEQMREDKRRALEEENRRVKEEEERIRRQKEEEAALVRREEEGRERERVEEMKRREDEKERLEEMRRRKEEEARVYREKVERWRNKQQRVHLPTGQQFIDKSTETRILDTVEEEEVPATTSTARPKVEENELENVVEGKQQQKKRRKEGKGGNPFTEELCQTLKVPCRFVTEHPCCLLPQAIGLVGRPRAMDGSADLRWRFLESSRGRQAEGRMIEGFGGRKAVARQPAASSFSIQSRPSPSIPYSHWTSKEVVAVPRYHYNGGPQVTSSILRHCWRLTYLNCAKERGHPCCRVHSKQQPGSALATNILDRWLARS